ncbi:MAG: hypothetical protein KC493_13465 [Bacteriovoracaceae bacterium]|nr:hypothetical protein [Bacteriovoracaceae bacterium]
MNLFTFFFIFSIILVMPGDAIGRSPAVANKDLSTISGLEAHIDRELRKTVSLIIKPSRFIIQSRVSVRANRRIKAQTFYLGKLGAQAKKTGKDKIIREQLSRRVRKVEIDFFIHPLVEPGKVKIAKNLIMNSTPFASPSKIKMELKEMHVLPETFMWDEYVDNIQFWAVANKRIFKIIGWILFSIVMIFGVGRWTWKFFKKKYQNVRSFVDSRVEELKNIGVENNDSNPNLYPEKIESQIKLFNVRTNNNLRRKAVSIKKWIYDSEEGSRETLAAIPSLVGESEFSSIFRALPLKIQNIWQEIISSTDWQKEEYKVFEYLQRRNLDSLKSNYSDEEYTLGETCVDLNCEQIALFIEKHIKYAQFISVTMSNKEWEEVISHLSDDVKTKISSKIVSTSARKVTINLEELHKQKTRVMNTLASESKKLEKFELLTASIVIKDVSTIKDIVKSVNNTEKLECIIRKAMPEALVMSLPSEVYTPILSRVPLKERVKFISVLEDNLKNKLLESFDKRMGDSGKVIRQELTILEQNEILSRKIKSNPSYYCKEAFELIRDEVKDNDHLYEKAQYRVNEWINKNLIGDNDADKAA